MKRLGILSVLLLFLCNSANGQWYNKKYGVVSLNYLTKAQLEGILKSENSLVFKSFLFPIVGIPVCLAGLNMINYGEKFGTFFSAMLLVIPGGLALTGIGLVSCIIHITRSNQVSRAISSPDLKLGLLTCPMLFEPGASSTAPAFGLTLTFHF